MLKKIITMDIMDKYYSGAANFNEMKNRYEHTSYIHSLVNTEIFLKHYNLPPVAIKNMTLNHMGGRGVSDKR
jgi:hypothetical protein